MPTTASSLSFFLMIALVFLSGVLTSFQHGMNRRFSSLAGNSIHGGILNFVVGLAAVLLLWAVLTKAQLPNRSAFSPAPWWMWLGCVCGGFYVCVAIFAIPRIGSAYHASALVVGQLVAAMVIDHFGLMGLDVKHVTPGRAIGLVLMIAGLVCMKFA